jgi:RTX calcium-binding nonapeptide repeat (4 copies)
VEGVVPVVTVNEYTSGGTGHVNISLENSSGGLDTYGRNITAYGGGTFREDMYLDRGDVIINVIYVNDAQLAAMRAYAEGQLVSDDYYLVAGHNCVDFVEEVLRSGGLNSSVNDYVSNDRPVNFYAGVSDFVDQYLGGDSQLVNDIVNSGGNFIEDAVEIYGNFVTSVENSGFFEAMTSFASGVDDAFEDWFGGLAVDDCETENAEAGGIDPIIIDLAGLGTSLLSVEESQVVLNGIDGVATHTGWVQSGAGILAYDFDGDGAVDGLAEIDFRSLVAGASTDLSALAALDENKDGRFTADDSEFGNFLVWADSNEDGIAQPNEVATLAQLGIASIDVTINSQSYAEAGSQVHNTTTVTLSDGTVRTALDITFAVSMTTDFSVNENITVSADASGWAHIELGDAGVRFDAVLEDVGMGVQKLSIQDGAGDDDIRWDSDISALISISGGGDNTVHAGGGDDIVVSGGGDDQIFGGMGLDTFIFEGAFGSDTLSTGEGGDIIVVTVTAGATIHISDSEGGVLLQTVNGSLRIQDFTREGPDSDEIYINGELIDIIGVLNTSAGLEFAA